MELFDPHGHRLYLAADERAAFLEAAKLAPREVRTFYHVLHDTGCRLSEALARPMRGVDLAGKVIVLETLKKRSTGRRPCSKRSIRAKRCSASTRLTGYYPVIFLAIYDKYGMVPASDILTGPLFVMQDTAAEVIELSAQGYR